MSPAHSRRALIVLTTLVAIIGVITVGVLVGGLFVGEADAASSTETTSPVQSSTTTDEVGVSEEPYSEPVPEEGDPFFEAEASDGRWISYINPRDDYRSPYLGDGSGKICTALLNEAGDPVVGESIPNTTVTVDTGDELEWHDDADPFVVEYPLTTHYDRPLDADQFGTTAGLPQGDGYLDSHCLEWHGLPEDETVRYGEPTIDGDHADDVELVGVVEQPNDTWDSDVDPIGDAQPYEETGGWTYYTDGSHGQAVVVLQLDRDGAALEDTTSVDDDSTSGDDSTGDDSDTATPDDGTDEQSNSSEPDAAADTDEEPIPGFGSLVALAAVAAVVVFGWRREVTP
ncbi:PGF-CTERM sorting domain-containing protein [Natrarchaeobaculum sulfurireducens]